MIELDCSFRSPAESNMFLRALWAAIRDRFGTVGWQYTPHRDGRAKRIRLGWATLGAASPDGVEISVRYRRRGIAAAVEFRPQGAIRQRYQNLDASLRACVAQALQTFAVPREYRLQSSIGSPRGERLESYKGARWWVVPRDDWSMSCGLTVLAFDHADAQHEFALRLGCLLDCLAVWTNCSFERLTAAAQTLTAVDEQSGYWLDADWLEGCPIEDGLLRLLPSQIAFADRVVDGSLDPKSQIARAARHFHDALALHMASAARFSELVTVLLVSALEAIGSENTEMHNCETCGQPVYKLSQRVVDLAIRHLGPDVERQFRDHYGRRSQFLHAGILSASQPQTGVLIPQLDPEAPEGCAMPRMIAQPINLIEFTSFLLRKEMGASAKAGSSP